MDRMQRELSKGKISHIAEVPWDLPFGRGLYQLFHVGSQL